MLGILTALSVVVQATLLADVVNSIFFQHEPVASVSLPLLLLVLVALARGLIAWALEAGGHRAAASTTRDLRSAFIRYALFDRPGDTLESRGATASTAMQGVDALDPYFARYLPALALGVIVPIVVLIRVATLDVTSAAIMLLTIPLIPIFGILIGKATEAQARSRYQALGRLSSHFLDVVRGLTTLRAFNRGAAQAENLEETGDAYRRETIGTLRIAFLSALVLELAATLATAVIAVEIGIRLVAGQMSFAPAFLILLLAPELYAPLRNAAAQFHASADGLAAADRILTPLESPPLTRGSLEPLSPSDVPIRFEHVNFSYPTRPQQVLDDATFELVPGERVAIVGPSGIGKSTIARLLLLFDHPDSGRIAIGDTDLRDVDPAAWRRLVAWVPQRPHLTSGTIAEAIALGRPEATRGEVADAARAAGAETFIVALPEGFETPVGDGGMELSAGQVRRIALARAFLRNAPLLLLDEPTTSLDHESAELIASALEALPTASTMLVITHDPDFAARIATRVLYVTAGSISDRPGALA